MHSNSDLSAQKNSKLSKFFNDIDEAIETFTNHDYGEDYKYYAKTNLKNGHYGLALLQFIDGCIEYTKDIFTVPTAIAISKVDNLCKENLGLDLSDMAMTLYSGGLLAPLGAELEYLSTWANATAAATGSKIVTTTTAVTVEVVNQAAGLVGINTNSVKLNAGQQSKHIKGHNYIHGRSILYGNLDDAQDLLNKYAGTGQRINEQKERVNFGKIIGVYVNPKTGEVLETTNGIIHYGKNGAHIVPSKP